MPESPVPDCFSPSRPKSYQEQAESLCEFCPFAEPCVYRPKQQQNSNTKVKSVFAPDGTWRQIFYNALGVQSAIIKVSTKGITVSVPIEGMGGWHVSCGSLREATKVAKRELSRRGKVINRVIKFPVYLTQGKLF